MLKTRDTQLGLMEFNYLVFFFTIIESRVDENAVVRLLLGLE